MTQRLLLNFICRNEADNIGRMLTSAAPWIVGCVCTDTGSTDDTPLMIEAFFRAHNKPCVITHEPFIDYSQARNAALRAARASGIEHDYLLLLDCDHELMVGQHGFPMLEDAAYSVVQDNGTLRFQNIRLLRSDQTVEYFGRTHEIITMPPEFPLNGLTSELLWIRDHETGSNRVDKYERDIRLLEMDLKDDPLYQRGLFYMLQSLRGAERYAEARDYADRRIASGGNEEEVWWSMFSKAQCGDLLGLPTAQVSHEYLTAFLYRSNRPEPLFFLGAHHRVREEYPLAIIYSRAAALMPPPQDVFIMEKNVYEWLALDDWLSLSLILEIGPDARHAAKMLKDRDIPTSDRERIEHNIKLVEQL